MTPQTKCTPDGCNQSGVTSEAPAKALDADNRTRAIELLDRLDAAMIRATILTGLLR